MNIEDLFLNYRDSFDALDAVLISDNYCLPCATSDGDGSLVFSQRDELIKKFSANCKTMASMGYHSSEFKILQLRELGKHSRAVTLSWRVKFVHDSAEFHCLYICQQENELWKIFSANVYPGAYQ